MNAPALSPLTQPSAAGPRPFSRQRLWDQVSIYLPVLLMALLAVASYWLLRATPEVPEPQPERPLTHEPDYVMQRFSVKAFDASGALRSEIFGAEARHYPDTRTVEIDNARIRSVGAGGQLTTATAQRIISNDEQTAFTLAGDAVVIREAGQPGQVDAAQRLEFRGEAIQVFSNPERVTSDRPVLLVRGNDRLQADTLDYQGGDVRVAMLSGRVRATLSPR